MLFELSNLDVHYYKANMVNTELNIWSLFSYDRVVFHEISVLIQVNRTTSYESYEAIGWIFVLILSYSKRIFCH